MKFNQLGKAAVVISLTAASQIFAFAPALSRPVYKVIGLKSDNTLVTYEYNSRRSNKIKIKGVDGNVLGIDFRPANNQLYAITDTDKIYTINSDSGVATLISSLSVSFSGGFQSGVDFNPVADRLRLVANNGENFRINVDTGEVVVDKPLNYNPPQAIGVTAAAYTNSRPGVSNTTLYNLDYDSDSLVIQNPPNDGTLNTVGSLGFNLPPIAGFDIVTNRNGENIGFIASGRSLYTVDLSTGRATLIGNFRAGNLIGIAATLSSKGR
ncbi:putative lipoprotein [Gloeocapsa sp. PCC 7428]|uniref:DUF4394 domain-containing protein n=1 Tax=Gloeocapsa sp. PCC 7428 TaxID=1173026 RepID=UPI0002A5CE78|nr:DUF4394 domain-containing protein [Gloeocapsa sp. PCC 7428]AFZ28866.1 putative lipoprotein [Gloeocapsa sp. PCC 7428]